MKKKKWIMPVICMAVLILLLGTYFILKNKNLNDAEVKADAENIKVNEMASEDIIGAAFIIEGENLSFTKTDDIWTMDGDADFPLDSTKITSVINGFGTLSAVRELKDIDDLGEYGLDNPQNEVVLTTKDGSAAIYLGAKNTSTGNTYLYLNDEKNTVYVISNDLLSLIPGKKMELAQGEEFPTITASNITNMQIKKDKDSFTLDKEDESGSWHVTDDEDNRYTAEDQTVSTLMSTITGMKFEELVDYRGEDMAQYGLEHPSAVIKVLYTDAAESGAGEDSEDSEDSSSSSSASSVDDADNSVEKSLILSVGDKSGDGNYYVNVDGSKDVHTMSQETLDSILGQKGVDYWDMTVSYITKDNLTGLTVIYKGDKNVIEKKSAETTDEDSNTETTFQSDGKEIDAENFDIFFNKMTGLAAQKKDKALSSNESPEMSITFHTDTGDKKITFAAYDENFYIVNDMEGRPGLISKTTVKEFFTSYENLGL